MKKTLLHTLLIAFIFTSMESNAQLKILSGPEQGAYHTFVKDIVNITKTDNEMPFVNYETEGAAFNFESLVSPSLDFKIAFIQMDYLYVMQARDMQNNTHKTQPLKVLIPMAREAIHLVSKASTGLEKLSDLNSTTTVGIGSKKQGTYSTTQYINAKTDLNWASKNTPYSASIQQLMLGDLDAFFFVGTAPLNNLNVMPQGFQDELTLLTIDNFKDWAKNYDTITIKASNYKWLDKDVNTYGVPSVLLVNEDKLTAEDKLKLKKLVETLKTNQKKLSKDGHPKWSTIDFDSWDKNYWPLIKLD